MDQLVLNNKLLLAELLQSELRGVYWLLILMMSQSFTPDTESVCYYGMSGCRWFTLWSSGSFLSHT